MNIRCFHRHFSLSSKPVRSLSLPSTMETHLWYVIPEEVKSLSLFDEYFEILSSSERENVLSLREDQLRKRAILARALVRTTMARYQNGSPVDPKSLEFKKNIHGKPEIGVDVEEKNRIMKNDVLSFARRFFSPLEVEHLSAIPDPEDQRQEFIKLWTLKEAYVKALGRGFSAAPFKTFTIHFRSNYNLSEDADYCKASEIVVETVDDSMNLTSNWQFALLELAGNHYAAICVQKNSIIEEGGSSQINLRVWKTIPLLEDECVSGTSSVITAGGLVKQLRSV